jgi:aminocarboxymuconate-semialdehyde decarboxylase
MSTRREFLKTGVVFCSCALLDTAHAENEHTPTGGRKLPVVVAGERVKTIDIHAHCHFREAGALLGAEAAAIQAPPVNGAAPSSR